MEQLSLFNDDPKVLSYYKKPYNAKRIQGIELDIIQELEKEANLIAGHVLHLKHYYELDECQYDAFISNLYCKMLQNLNS